MYDQEDLFVRPATEKEQLYDHSWSFMISGLTGCIGMLKYNFMMDKPDFQEEQDYTGRLKGNHFEEDQNDLFQVLMESDKWGSPLKDVEHLTAFCKEVSKGEWDEKSPIVFRMDFGRYTYIATWDPEPGMYNLKAMCYVSHFLDLHMEEIEDGICIEDGYHTTCIEDGNKIEEEYPDNTKMVYTCRLLDEEHMQLFTPIDYEQISVDRYRETVKENHIRVRLHTEENKVKDVKREFEQEVAI